MPFICTSRLRFTIPESVLSWRRGDMTQPLVPAATSPAAGLILVPHHPIGLLLSPSSVIARLRRLHLRGPKRDPALRQPSRNDQLTGLGVARSSHRPIPSLARRGLISSPTNGPSLSLHRVRDSTGETATGHAVRRRRPSPRRGSSRCQRRCGHRKGSLPRTGMGRGLCRPRAWL